MLNVAAFFAKVNIVSGTKSEGNVAFVISVTAWRAAMQ